MDAPLTPLAKAAAGLLADVEAELRDHRAYVLASDGDALHTAAANSDARIFERLWAITPEPLPTGLLDVLLAECARSGHVAAFESVLVDGDAQGGAHAANALVEAALAGHRSVVDAYLDGRSRQLRRARVLLRLIAAGDASGVTDALARPDGVIRPCDCGIAARFAAATGNVSALRALLSDPRLRDAGLGAGELLILAARAGSVEALSALLADQRSKGLAEADFDASAQAAARSGHAAAVEALLSHLADEAYRSASWSCIAEAVLHGHAALARHLLSSAPRPRKVPRRLVSAVARLIERGDAALADRIVAAAGARAKRSEDAEWSGVRATAVQSYAQAGDHERARELLAAAKAHGDSAAHAAAEGALSGYASAGDADGLERLFGDAAASADLDRLSLTDALQTAARHGSARGLDCLLPRLEAAAEAEGYDEPPLSPFDVGVALGLAARCADLAALRFLLSDARVGADASTIADAAETAARMSALPGLDVLLDAGACPVVAAAGAIRGWNAPLAVWLLQHPRAAAARARALKQAAEALATAPADLQEQVLAERHRARMHGTVSAALDAAQVERRAHYTAQQLDRMGGPDIAPPPGCHAVWTLRAMAAPYWSTAAPRRQLLAGRVVARLAGEAWARRRHAVVARALVRAAATDE